MQNVNQVMKNFDIIITPSFVGKQLSITNLTGHPALCMPIGFTKQGSPNSITFLANLFKEEDLLAFGKYFQDNTKYEDVHPPKFK
jgi:Asp-tRNA(Asn)/Glu-tRNA(Gln) amidotransferase A subunit family amidase